MAIRDRDGKVYKLRGPNPLMKDQSEWDRSKTKLINLSWGSEVVEDARNPIREFEENLVSIDKELGLKPNKEVATVISPKQFIEELQELPEPEPVPEPVKPEPPTINVEPQVARLLKEKGVVYYCAPVIGIRKQVDDLYGTVYERKEYGDKFLFDAIIVAESDLQIQFWCVKPVTVNSVVYRKIKEGGERWWRINELEPKSGGYLVRAIPSDSNPDFS
jgi:hypothetical protein